MRFSKQFFLSTIFISFLFSIALFTACHKKAKTIDPCASVTCNNGGTCSNGTCACPTGYSGAYCDSILRDKFIASWSGSLTCLSGNTSNIMAITAGNTDTKVIVENAAGFPHNVSGDVVSATKISVPLQQMSVDTSIAGTITLLSATEIKFEYTLEGTTHDACHGNYTKQ